MLLLLLGLHHGQIDKTLVVVVHTGFSLSLARCVRITQPNGMRLIKLIAFL